MLVVISYSEISMNMEPVSLPLSLSANGLVVKKIIKCHKDLFFWISSENLKIS